VVARPYHFLVPARRDKQADTNRPVSPINRFLTVAVLPLGRFLTVAVLTLGRFLTVAVLPLGRFLTVAVQFLTANRC